MGFLLFLIIVFQIVSGILLALYYISDINYSYYSVMYIIREVYYGWCLRYIHSNGASFIFGIMYFHIGRGLYVSSYVYNTNLWLSGIVLFIFLMAIAFLGYILTWGQMSFWGGTVITNLFSSVPCIIEWMCGGFYVSNPTLKRFFIFHFMLSFITIGFVIIHFYYLHYISSNNLLGYNINNLIIFFPIILIKDSFGLFILSIGYIFQLFLGIFSLSHPDNSVEVNGLVTPLHIVPEWYFLSFYAVLKAIPNKNVGFIIFLTSVLLLFLLGEVKNVSTISRLISYMWINGNLFIIYFFFIMICELWIGAQLPQDIFLSYGRILNFFNNLILWSNL